MRIVILPDAAAVASACAGIVAEEVSRNPELVLALPTGRTAVPLYDELARRHADGEIDLGRARAFNLDELLLPPGHPGSFRSYMARHAGGRIGLRPERCAIPDPAAEPAAECARYEQAIVEAGGFDLALVGLGADGHVAYNLPGPAHEQTHVVVVPEAVAETLEVPAGERPLGALTIGFGALRSARRLVLMATSAAKVEAVRALLDGPMDEQWPCTLLRDHASFDVLLSAAAAGERS